MQSLAHVFMESLIHELAPVDFHRRASYELP